MDWLDEILEVETVFSDVNIAQDFIPVLETTLTTVPIINYMDIVCLT